MRESVKHELALRAAEQTTADLLAGLRRVVDAVDAASFDDPDEAAKPLPASAPMPLRLLRRLWLEYHAAETAEQRIKALDAITRFMGVHARGRDVVMRTAAQLLATASQQAINRERLAIQAVCATGRVKPTFDVDLLATLATEAEADS